MAGGTKIIDTITFIQRSQPLVTPASFASIYAALNNDGIQASINGGNYSVVGRIPSVPGIYGDGYDGNLNFDGTSTITLGNGDTIVPSSSIYSLARDIYPRSIVIATGVTLKTECFRIFCYGETNVVGTLQNNGPDGANGGASGAAAGGTAVTAETLGTGSSAGNGGTTGVGGNGTALTVACGNAGGAGGSGSGGAGGNAGVLTPAFPANQGSTLVCRSIMASFGTIGGTASTTCFNGGSGGGGGGGTTTTGQRGGGGGAGAGVLLLCSKTIVGAGTIRANGGKGGDAYQVSGNSGGGGGGGGGVLLIVTDTSIVPTTQANGGTHGIGFGTGSLGSDGGNGFVITLIRA